ncbi:MAG: PQQ-binding-like beta-propeller repeat protein [Verrucomicrobiota bacterium]|nr:PQQ-binding-like beta-propeller repeat protein [Verrucomicrobiota bacterium]
MKVATCLLGLNLVLNSSLFSLADDWPQWLGPKRTGKSDEKNWQSKWPDEGPKQLWKASVGTGYSSMSVSNGRLFTMGNVKEVDHVYCLDAVTGKELWKHSYPCSSSDPNGFPGTRCTPTVDGNKVYTLSRMGHLFCLNFDNGEVIWSREFVKDFGAKVPTWGFSGSPLVEGKMVLVETGAEGASLIALDKETGAILWKAGNEGPGYSSPVAYTYKDKRYVLMFSGFGLVAREMANGKEAWRFPWKTSYDVNAATPLVVGDRVFISSAYNKGCAVVQFTDNKPSALWQGKNMRNHVSTSIFHGGHLYGFDETDLRCLDFETGMEKWSEKKFGKGSLIFADGKLIIFSDKGLLATAEANPKKYTEISSAQVLGGKNTWSSPILANGRLYARSLENLVALDVQGETKTAVFEPLFPEEGEPRGWKVRDWSDVKRQGPEKAKWVVKSGVLHGSEPRGTWLVSEQQYGDFQLEFEFKLGQRGNSGCGLRFPGHGDPAFDGIELQMVDPRYYPPDFGEVPANELTGSLYRVVAPSVQVFKPMEWNKYEVTMKGPLVKVKLNGQQVLDVNLNNHTSTVKRHTEEIAVSLKDRPRKGHIGFQELSRDGGHVEIRHAKIKVLD